MPSRIKRRRRSARGRRTRQSGIVSWKAAMLSVTAAAVFGGIGYMAINDAQNARADEQGCYHAPRQARTAVLLDASVGFDQAQTRDLRNIITSMYWDELDSNERFDLVTTEEHRIGSVAAPRISLCRTARGPDDLERVGASAANTAYLEREAERVFGDKVAPFLDTFLDPDADPKFRQGRESPILEQVQSIARIPGFTNGDGKRRLVVISDLIQNVEEARFCRTRGDLPQFDRFKDRQYFGRVQPRDLGAVDVTIYMALQPGYGAGNLAHCTEEELHQFWRAFFRHAGAKSVDIVRLRKGTDWQSVGGL